MRVLITNVPLQFYHRTAFFFRDHGAVNLAILATALEKKHEVRTVDNWHHWVRSETIFKQIREFQPDVIGISHTTEVDTEVVYELLRRIRHAHPGVILVGGGQYPTMFPQEALENGFHYVVRGEGEVTFPELLDALEGNRPLSQVQGVSHRQKRECVANPERPPIDFNESPLPSLRFAPKYKSWYFPGKYASVIETARGCPYHCDFCIVTAFFQQRWQRRDNHRIVNEIKNLKYNKGIDHFYFLDESWGINPPAYEEFCQTLIDERLDIKWYPSGMRTDTIAKNPGLLKIAARAGMYGTLIGFESYNNKTLDDAHKQSCVRYNRRASEVMRSNKLIVYGVHIYGLPGEKDFTPTYREGSRLSDIFCVSMFSLLPGTPLFLRAQREGTAEKIPVENRMYPYSYFMRGEGRDMRKMTREFLFWHLRYHLSPRNIFDTLFSRGVKKRFKIADYISCVQYVVMLLIRKVRPAANFPVPAVPAATETEPAMR